MPHGYSADAHDSHVTGGFDGGETERMMNTWTCRECEATNSLSDDECTGCGESRPEMERPEREREEREPQHYPFDIQ